MSGGEQQMLAIGRALMARPQLLLLDEPSLGLAPVIVDKIYEIVREINAAGTTILLVEQNANYALDVSTRGYVLETGTVALTDSSENLRNDRASRTRTSEHDPRPRSGRRQGALAPLHLAASARSSASGSPGRRATARRPAWHRACVSASSAFRSGC